MKRQSEGSVSWSAGFAVAGLVVFLLPGLAVDQGLPVDPSSGSDQFNWPLALLGAAPFLIAVAVSLAATRILRTMEYNMELQFPVDSEEGE